MRTALLTATLLAAALPALAQSRAVKVVDGKEVVPGRRLAALPIVEIRDLRFYDCTLADTKTPCTVITGSLFSRLPTADFVVTVTIDFHDKHLARGTFHQMGSATKDVLRPSPARPTQFLMLGPDCLRNRDADPAPAAFSGYTLSLTVKPFKPQREWQ